MTDFQSSTDGQPTNNDPSDSHPLQLFTPKRVGYTLAGAFVFVSAALSVANPASSGQKSTNKSSTFTLHQESTATPTESNQAHSVTSTLNVTNDTTPSGSNDVSVQVNGHAVPVPEDGTSEQDVYADDGSHTHVTISNNSSSQTTNNSVHFEVHSESTSEGDNAGQ